jgi:hypothetical protein
VVARGLTAVLGLAFDRHGRLYAFTLFCEVVMPALT